MNSRQLAGVVWLVIFIGWALTHTAVRDSVRSMLKTMFTPKLILLFGGVISAFVAFTWLLWREGRWDWTMLYDTVLFVAVGGIGSVSRAASQDVTYDARFYAKTVLVNFEVMALFVFLSDFFPFTFWVEFLVVVPLATLLAILVVVSDYRKGADQVHRLLSEVQGILGILLIGYVILRVITDHESLMTTQVLSSLILPFVLSMLFLPVLVLVCAVFAYEDAFLVITFKSGQSDQLIRWKKWRLVRRFGLNLVGLQSVRRSPFIHEYAWLKTQAEAIALLNQWSGHDAVVAPAWEGEE
jgi:hypothetical protein